MISLETRVGYKAIDILKLIIEDYIKANTINGRYMGEQRYLGVHKQLSDYLTGGGGVT